MVAPLTNVTHRIQNVDYTTYIERPNGTSFVAMRPFKDSTRQQWNFVDAGSDTYYIQNVKVPSEYLDWTPLNGVHRVLVSPRNFAKTWIVSLEEDSYFIKLSTDSSNLIQTDATLQVNMTSDATGYDNERWNLEPVDSPDSLAPGYYRIRSFNGLYLLTLPSGTLGEDSSLFVKTQVVGDLYQRWLITRQTDGSYVILSSGEASSRYIDCKVAQAIKGDNPVAMGTPFSWHFRNLGLPSLFSVDLPQTGLSIGFANFSVQSNEDVFLEPSDNTPSQMWFFEKYIPFDKEKVHAQRQPGIDEGTYYIQNCYDSTNYMNYVGSPPRIQSGGPKSGKTTRFTLKYEENSAELTLAYNEVSSTTPPTITPHRVADVGGSLSCANMATNWVLLKEDEKDPGYYICRPDAGYPRRVISSRHYTGVDLNTYFAIDNMREGDVTQM